MAEPFVPAEPAGAPKIPFVKKLVTGALAGLVIGEAAFRFCVTFLRPWVSLRVAAPITLISTVAALVCVVIWQARTTNNPATLAFWQGLIRYGVAFNLASFGWEKICHLQLVLPGSKLDLPYSSFSPSDLFWYFFSHSYLFGCIIAGLQIAGAMLLLFRRTRLAGVFVLLPVVANILLMDIFYEIGGGVVFHASVMMAGLLYFLFIEFDRLKQFFFATKDQLPALHFSTFLKTLLRLSIIYVPLLFIAMHGSPDKYPHLTGKYEVKALAINQHPLYPPGCADSILTVIYLDIKNGCVFEFNTPQRRWNGTYSLDHNHLEINWRSPADKPEFKGMLSPGDSTGRMRLNGTLGKDSITLSMQRTK
jgi:hypothetical protein